MLIFLQRHPNYYKLIQIVNDKNTTDEVFDVKYKVILLNLYQ